ncbi:TPA: hypothetical protein ACXR0H_003345 [Klebsiella variicola subsp. variicola]|uniref:long-chain fatty acid--CoA ligase n=1 Tax=Enterobacteriaceae TaxID=543 RepID=UPI00115C8D02|nr:MULTISPECIES: long-chain fatty acid--CoA ligase [Enterobacteriaceae]MDP0955343.1 hypothetical protein [Klebsiella pneumoniae]MDP0960965.1 hypothetical protein [Klebsiella pneumoniae]MDP1041399.1 hypothetical protein [Klebsiella pneumoniae]MDP1311344.1 hypothetical protein [Klebsiella pneumoniae]MDP1320650.1 hypothetical protein [Klebsiella pneumoniae]
MPITETEWKEHHQKFGTQSIETMSIEDYRCALAEEAFFWDEPHGFIVHTLSGERIVTNTEQLDTLLEHLEGYRDKLPSLPT